MTTTSRVLPAKLEPHVARGPLAAAGCEAGSLTVVTWVQGASANWLLLRYLYALLGGGGGGGRGSSSKSEDGLVGVVLLSFLRDERFWAEGCARLGMDIDALRKSGRFSFVDGLTEELLATPDGHDPWTDAVKTRVDDAAARLLPAPLRGGRKVLLVDGLDAHVAMAASATEAESLLMRLRETMHSTLVTLAADEPLLRAAIRRPQQQQQDKTTTTGLERQQAALVLNQVHAANQVVSLRRLDTGAAADVSGVLRIATVGEDGQGGAEEELLYHVAGDGSVRVFERGA
ncbi:hypothetical protein CCM_03181 [Cordyceps militaris CM01]|uniref:Uncharacterized protein n=1 Tax=Cordyceps militaris (strain CM01) TaxID=983644 RepID=G3J981_CORMM|nr:uncharacterized protein CCM_03181 [Cordyceps militaris CM01]EGX94910.1 hypothetical protein CCM_03181 [Cordyceps militaris CM01]